jgi:hypothetical protein
VGQIKIHGFIKKGRGQETSVRGTVFLIVWLNKDNETASF